MSPHFLVLYFHWSPCLLINTIHQTTSPVPLRLLVPSHVKVRWKFCNLYYPSIFLQYSFDLSGCYLKPSTPAPMTEGPNPIIKASKLPAWRVCRYVVVVFGFLFSFSSGHGWLSVIFLTFVWLLRKLRDRKEIWAKYAKVRDPYHKAMEKPIMPSDQWSISIDWH